MYRIVVADSRTARDGRFVATIGHYHPRATPALIDVDLEQARGWLAKGAVPTDTVRALLKKAGVFRAAAPAAPAAPPGEA
jgi:small subunit ribosomal protein S16